MGWTSRSPARRRRPITSQPRFPDTCSPSLPDVTSQLNASIDTAPDGASGDAPSILQFPSSSCYHTEGSIEFGHPNPNAPYGNTGRNNLSITTDGSSPSPVTFQSYNVTNSGHNSVYPDVKHGGYGVYPLVVVDHPSEYDYPSVLFGVSRHVSHCGNSWGPGLNQSDPACPFQ